MHQKGPKHWLVRTQAREILGPYSESEMLQALHAKEFSADAEICQTGHTWQSASTLVGREGEEHTMTHTRTQLPPTASISVNPLAEELPAEEPLEKTTEINTHAVEESSPKKLVHLAVLVLIVSGVWMTFSQFGNNSGDQKTGLDAPAFSGNSQLTKEAEWLIRTHEYSNAIARLAAHHEQNKEERDVDYLIPYGAALVLQGETIPKAKKLLEQVINSNHSSLSQKAGAHHWIGYAMLSDNEGDFGENHFLEALQLNPKDLSSRFNLGCAYLRQKKPQQALDYFLLAELELPNFWLIQIYKGRAKRQLGLVEEARTAFQKAIELSPDRWVSYLYYAIFLKANHETQLAAQTLRSMLTRDPHFEKQAPVPLGFFEESVPFEDYLQTYNEILPKGSGHDVEVGRQYIAFLMNGPHSSEAKKIEATGEKEALMGKVFALKVALDRGAPENEIKRWLTVLPANLNDFGAYAYILRAEAQSRLGQLDEAAQELKKASALSPNGLDWRWSQIGILKKQHQEVVAEQELKRLLAAEPGFIPGLKLLGQQL